MDKKCIFCKGALNGSDEHIIPNSLNGRLHTKKLICKSCNNKFGITLDPCLKELLDLTIHILEIGRLKKIVYENEEGEKYYVDRNGNMQAEKIHAEISIENGKISIQGSGSDELSVFKALSKKMLRELGVKRTFQIVKNNKFSFTRKQLAPTPLFRKESLEITQRHLLAIEKIICEYYAYCGLDLSLISKRLEKVYTLKEDVSDFIIVNKRQEVRKPESLEISHLIVIRSSHGKLYAYIELFNLICGYMVLSEKYLGSPVDFAYHQDAISGMQLDKDIAIDLDAIRASDESLEFLHNSLLYRHRDRKMSKYITEVSDTILKSLDEQFQSGKITEEEKKQHFLKAIAMEIGRLTVEFPDQFEFEEEDGIELQYDKLNYIHSLIRAEHKDSFMFYYHQLIGKKLNIESEQKIYTIIDFHFVKAMSKKQGDYLKVFFHIKSEDNSHELHIVAKELFAGIGLPPPPPNIAVWLL